MSLPKYQCHKVVEAFKIAQIVPEKRTDVFQADAILRSEEGFVWFVDQAYLDKHKPEIGGYFVRYEDGYVSFSPSEAFEAGYIAVGETPRKAFRITFRRFGVQNTVIVQANDLADAIARVSAKRINAEFECGEPVGETLR